MQLVKAYGEIFSRIDVKVDTVNVKYIQIWKIMNQKGIFEFENGSNSVTRTRCLFSRKTLSSRSKLSIYLNYF